ncbi:hypothetical protein [Brevibacillus centrosporus]|nr:hypothetical protein [Brevibacillus centrosporus]
MRTIQTAGGVAREMAKHNNKRPTEASAGSRSTPPKTGENTGHNLRKENK